jgi:hypothetical protein
MEIYSLGCQFGCQDSWQCSTYYQWLATQSNVLRLTLQPIAFSDRDLADVFYSSVEVVQKQSML